MDFATTISNYSDPVPGWRATMRKNEMPKPNKTPSASTLMRRARTAGPRAAKRLRAQAAAIRATERAAKAKKPERLTRERIAEAQREANDVRNLALSGLLDKVPEAVKKALSDSPTVIMGGIGDAQQFLVTPVADEAANDTPTPEQLAWERGRMEGRSEMRAEVRRRRIHDFMAMVDQSQVSGVRTVQIGLDFAQDLVEALWAAGYSNNGQCSQPKG